MVFEEVTGDTNLDTDTELVRPLLDQRRREGGDELCTFCFFYIQEQHIESILAVSVTETQVLV